VPKRRTGEQVLVLSVAATVLAAAVVVFAMLHLVGDELLGGSPGLTNLDDERNLPTIYSGLLLLAGGVTFALVVQRQGLARPPLPSPSSSS